MSLSTLIVQREIASIREVEEALARQVLYGGDLITNLLEVCRLDEAQLLPIVAESLGLPPAPPGELPRPDPEAQRLVAAEVAVQRNLAPLTVDRYGLVIAVAEPLTAEVEQELSFALAMPISQKIAPLVRIRQALTRDYGVPLDRRLQRLLLRMMTEGPRSSTSFPPLHNADIRLGAPRPPSILPAAPLPAPVPPVRPSVPPGGGARTLMRATEAPPARPQRRRRGAITVDGARTELEAAGERDTIFDLLFEFARQYFDYTAFFIVHGEIAEGRDAYGDGSARDKVARIGMPLDMPSILSLAREKKATIQKVPAGDGLDAVLMSDLGRAGKTVCIVLPVVVRTRVVAMLVGDGGDTGIAKQTLAEVEGIVAQASAAFERLIVRRKLKGSVPPGDSLLPRGVSMAPPTKLSAASDRPSIEELAPPIRDLMMEPVSFAPETLPQVLAVRWPSGAPIPREEPESKPRSPAVTAPSNLGPFAQAAQAAAYVAAGPPSSQSAPRSRARRGEAPKLEFNAVPPPSSSFGSERFGQDDAERQLLAEIHGRTDGEPATSRDPSPAGGAGLAPSAPPPPLSSEPYPPSSPKAESPPPQRATAPYRPAVATATSPGALPMFAALPASAASMQLDAEDSDVSVVDQEPTPLSPMVDMDGVTPYVRPVPGEPWGDEPSASAGARVPPVPETSRVPMPASEQQISVPAHRPPSSRSSDQSRVLPSVIVDVASEYVGLVERVLEGARDPSALAGAEEAETALLRAGGYAMPAIMAYFPGPATIDRDRLLEGLLPRVADCGPVLRLVASQRRTALPFVLSHVEDPEVEKRFWATYLLTELVYPDVLEPILLRIFDEEPRVRRVARAAARAFADAQPATIVERIELVAMDGGENRERRMLAVETLGETRSSLAVPALLPLLEDPHLDIAEAVRSALTLITRQDFGTAAVKWKTWWAQHHDRHRLEWLIDALMHDQAALRAAAGEELKTTTKEYFGYYDDLPKRERERAQSRYREWWNSIGRVRFSRSSSSRG